MAPSYRLGEAALRRRALLGLLPDTNDETSLTPTPTPPSPSPPPPATTPAVVAAADPTTTTGGGGLLGDLTSAVGDIGSAVGNIGSSTSSTSSLPPTTSTVPPTSTSSTTLPATTSSSTTTSSSSTTSTSPTSEATTTTYLSTSDNQVITITATLQASVVESSSAESETATPAGTQQSFLQNKPLSGTVFALAGVVGLVIIVMLSTWFIRRSRRNRLEREAEAFAEVWPSTDGASGGAVLDEKRNLARTPSGRTAGSDQSLLGGGMAGAGAVAAGYGGHRQRGSDGTISQGLPSPPPHAQMQMQQNTSAMGMGMNTFNPLPPPPGLTGPRTGTTPPPLMQQQPAYAPYESPYAAYQQPAYMATTYGGYPQQQYQPQMSAMPPPPQDNSQMYGYTSRSSDGSHSSTDRGPPSVFGHKTSNSGGGSRSGTGAASGEQQRNDMRASASSDAYADYAFATGPGQSGAQPRNLTIANA